MGVNKAPPRLSSDPKAEVGLLQEMESGSGLGTVLTPLESIGTAFGSVIAGGRGKTCAPEVTCTTRFRACRYEGRVL